MGFEPFFPTAGMLQSTGAEQAQWHQAAAAATRPVFGNSVFVRAVLEISNHCRENCSYCGMRRDNRALQRRRARVEDLARLLIGSRPGIITDVNLQAGEDPVAVREVALPLLRLLRRETNLGLSVCLGTLPAGLYAELREAGATVYIMKFEIGDDGDYQRFAAPGTLHERLEHIRLLADTGWHVSSGFIAGLPGRGVAGALQDLELAQSLPLVGCSVSPFIPGDTTPLGGHPDAGAHLTLNCMAAIRLLRPDWVIPAVSALSLSGEPDAYRRAFALGANLATINLTPDDLRADYVIYRRDRLIMTEERIRQALDDTGLDVSAGSLADFHARRHLTRLAVTSPSAGAGSTACPSGRAAIPQQPGRQVQDRPNQGEQRLHGQSEQAERQQDQPDHRCHN